MKHLWPLQQSNLPRSVLVSQQKLTLPGKSPWSETLPTLQSSQEEAKWKQTWQVMAGMDKLDFIERSEKLRLETIMNYYFLNVLNITFGSLLSPLAACSENLAARIIPRSPFQ